MEKFNWKQWYGDLMESMHTIAYRKARYAADAIAPPIVSARVGDKHTIGEVVYEVHHDGSWRKQDV